MTVRLCRIDELPDGAARGFRLPSAAAQSGSRILVWRRGERLRAYRNRCPHRGTPLDWVEDRFMDREGEHLVCATHGALFHPLDGRCVAGPCAGDALDPVAVQVRDGEVYVG
jgi:nitrite reductase/ring-hydroxylating ferredoxin subunit